MKLNHFSRRNRLISIKNDHFRSKMAPEMNSNKLFFFQKTHNTSLHIESFFLWKKVNFDQNYILRPRWFLRWTKIILFGQNWATSKKHFEFSEWGRFSIRTGRFWSKMTILKPIRWKWWVNSVKLALASKNRFEIRL